MYDDYKYSKSNVKVNIQGQKTFVSADIKESMSIQGQNISGESKEQITLEFVNGSLLITDIIAYTTM